ncbi:MAG TPA: M20/M25/M40 family metallo-hydrolase [Candidatus Brocadiia bacterium]|nr:M20/M25/M40 family metallo-hydrolase [Candidatus Brocadiia bacterium]
MYTMLRRKMEGVRDDAAKFAQEMVKLPSPSLAEGQVADVVERKMRELGYDKVVRDEYGNVAGVLLGRTDGKTLLLNTHMDTVTPSGTWSEDPYSARIADGRLYGVGAGDCKGGLAAQVYGAHLLRRALLPLEGHVVVAATVAEEYGRSAGVRRLLEKTLPSLSLKPAYAVLGEPTGLGLYYGHDGWAEMEVRIEGANPFQVEDAATAVYRDLNRLDGGPREDKLGLAPPRFQDVAGGRRATINVAKRLVNEESLGGAISELKRAASAAAKSSGAVAVDVEVRQETQKLYTGTAAVVRHVTHSWSTDPFNPVMERSRHALAAAGLAVRTGKWRLGRLGMGTAGSLMVEEFNLPTIGYGPGEEEKVHAANESVSLDAVAEAIYGTACIAHSLAGVPVFGWTSDDI